MKDDRLIAEKLRIKSYFVRYGCLLAQSKARTFVQIRDRNIGYSAKWGGQNTTINEIISAVNEMLEVYYRTGKILDQDDVADKRYSPE